MRPEADPRGAPGKIGRCLGPRVSQGQVPDLGVAALANSAGTLPSPLDQAVFDALG
jgi:hypothetical protein